MNLLFLLTFLKAYNSIPLPNQELFQNPLFFHSMGQEHHEEIHS